MNKYGCCLCRLGFILVETLNKCHLKAQYTGEDSVVYSRTDLLLFQNKETYSFLMNEILQNQNRKKFLKQGSCGRRGDNYSQ